MRAPRQHRLPQRLDYTLIPAPLDLSKPLVDEKAALPAIIVTPSSPSGETDFHIAFLAPEPKASESLVSRAFSRLGITAPALAPPQIKARTICLLFLPLFILACHLIAHHLAVRRPHLHFDSHTQGGLRTGTEGDAGWFDLRDYWGSRQARDFIIVEPAR